LWWSELDFDWNLYESKRCSSHTRSGQS